LHQCIQHPTRTTKRTAKNAQIAKRSWRRAGPDARACHGEDALGNGWISSNANAASCATNINATPHNSQPCADHCGKSIICSRNHGRTNW
jgi:hypothetical protein